jgi:hypothetical protein
LVRAADRDAASLEHFQEAARPCEGIGAFTPVFAGYGRILVSARKCDNARMPDSPTNC